VKRAARVAVGSLAVVGAAAIALSLLAQFAVDCEGRRISSAASPSGKTIAEHHQTTCRSDNIPKSEIQIVRAGTRVGTEIGVATTNSIGLAWEDDDSLVVSVPPGMDKAFDRELQGVRLKFEVVTDAARLTPNKTMEPTR
jgi:hypothetical protein